MNLSIDNSYLELLRPGFTRISLPFFINENELAFVMEAIKMVATEGWKLLPQYLVDLDTGEWRHHSNPISKDRKWLGSIRYVDGKMTMSERRISGPGLFPQSYAECLQTARNLFNRARKSAMRNPYPDQGITFDSRAEKLRWFMTPQEAQDMLTSNSQNVKQTVPFDPVKVSMSRRRADSAASFPISPTSSPRHYSLPAIDDPRILGCSSPVPYFVQDINTVYYSQGPQVNFAVGECVNSHIMSPMPSPLTFRERCFSLGAPNVSPPILSPQTRASLGINPTSHPVRSRNCSCSSQNEMHSLDSDLNMSPTHSINVLSASTIDVSQVGRSSPVPDLQTYVAERAKEMAVEMATNIKSEIREVISIVEDGLENNDLYSIEKHGSGSEDGRSESISAVEVAEYLGKLHFFVEIEDIPYWSSYRMTAINCPFSLRMRETRAGSCSNTE